jgi:hypothetical protein
MTKKSSMSAHLKRTPSKQKFVTQHSIFSSRSIFPSPHYLNSTEALQMAAMITAPQAKQ